jgi:hypothetical protein
MDSARQDTGCHLTQETSVMGLMDSAARHVIGCKLTQSTRVQNAFDDVAITMHHSLAAGAKRRGGGGDQRCRARHPPQRGMATGTRHDATLVARSACPRHVCATRCCSEVTPCATTDVCCVHMGGGYFMTGFMTRINLIFPTTRARTTPTASSGASGIASCRRRATLTT